MEAARVRQDGLIPRFKPVQATKLLDDVHSRAQPQVEGVAQNDLRAHIVQACGHHALDRAVGTDWHEYGGFNHAVIQRQTAPARERAKIGALGGIGVEGLKFQHDSNQLLAVKQHGVAIAEETVGRQYRVSVKRHHVRITCERADEHHQGRFG